MRIFFHPILHIKTETRFFEYYVLEFDLLHSWLYEILNSQMVHKWFDKWIEDYLDPKNITLQYCLRHYFCNPILLNDLSEKIYRTFKSWSSPPHFKLLGWNASNSAPFISIEKASPQLKAVLHTSYPGASPSYITESLTTKTLWRIYVNCNRGPSYPKFRYRGA